MAAANLDEVKKKYKFKDISVATWRDPALSVHPARGGPASPNFPLDSVFVPTYKAEHDRSSQSTDDEPGDYSDTEESKVDVSLNSAIERLDEPESTETKFETYSATLPSIKQDLDNHEGEADDPSELPSEQIPDLSLNDIESKMAPEDGHEVHSKSAFSDVNFGAFEAVGEAEGENAPDSQPPDAGEEGMAAGATTPSEAGSEERRVSFAPGTPDPKPTERKKKTPKGTKSRKKRTAVPIDSLPADVMAMIDGAFEGLPPPPSATAAATEDVIVTDAVPVTIAPTGATPVDDSDPPENSTAEASLPSTDSAMAPSMGEVVDQAVSQPPDEHTTGEWLVVQGDDLVPESIAAIDVPKDLLEDSLSPSLDNDVITFTEKSSKKKSSKSSKDKSKKKSSKSKSGEISAPVGLDIDIPPPPIAGFGMPKEENVSLNTDNEESALQPPQLGYMEETNSGAEIDTNVQAEVSQSPTTEPVSQGEGEDTGPGENLLESAKDSNAEEPKAVLGSDSATDGTLVDAWDQSPDINEQTDPPVIEDNLVAKDKELLLEPTSSPEDSGVEFDYDAGKGADKIIEDTTNNEIAKSDSPDSGSIEGIDHAAHVDADQPDNVAIDAPMSDGTVAEHPVAADETARESTEAQNAEEAYPENDRNTEQKIASEEVLSTGSSGDDSTDKTASDVLPPDVDASSAETTAQGIPTEETTTVQATAAGDEAIASLDQVAAPPEEIGSENTGEMEHAAAVEQASNYEPPALEDDPGPDASESGECTTVIQDDAFLVEQPDTKSPVEQSVGLKPVSEAPPSPNLSKSSSHGSHKHKADHWERKHAENALGEVFKDSKALERQHSPGNSGKDEIRVRDRHRKSRRLATVGEDEEERKRRRAARRIEGETRLAEDKKRAEDEAKRTARRSVRKERVEEDGFRIDGREPAKNDDAARRRHRERESAKGDTRANRTLLPSFTLPGIPKAISLTSGESVHGATVVRSHGGAYRPVKEPTRAPAPTSAPKEEVEVKGSTTEAKSGSPPSSGGEKTHHRHRHRRHRSDADRSSRDYKESGRRSRRSSIEERVEERPRSFLGLVRI